MKITHVIGSLDPAGGGPPQVAARLAAAQAHDGHTVRLVSYTSTGRETQVRQSLQSVPYLDAVDLVYLPPPATRLHRVTAGHVRAELSGIVKDSDVLHMHGVWETLLRAAAGVARRLDRAYVVRPAGMLDPWSMSQKGWKKRLAMKLAYKKMLDGALFIHALNGDEAGLIGPLKLSCPVTVIPNGVFQEEIEPLPQPGTFRSQHPQLAGHPFVMFMARLHYKKGLDYLADSFHRLTQSGSEAHLVVAGPDEGAQQDFENRVRQLGLSDRVHVVGPIYGETKYAALTDAACFCLPSRQEGFSVAITEALACGAPCVISEPCHFPEVAQANAGRVTPLNAEAVGRALIEVMGDEQLRNRMSENARELVRQRYNWPAIAKLTVETYQKYQSRQ
jgi:glycosyltransferase involved in cell wall biosynthesis